MLCVAGIHNVSHQGLFVYLTRGRGKGGGGFLSSYWLGRSVSVCRLSPVSYPKEKLASECSHWKSGHWAKPVCRHTRHYWETKDLREREAPHRVCVCVSRDCSLSLVYNSCLDWKGHFQHTNESIVIDPWEKLVNMHNVSKWCISINFVQDPARHFLV